MTDVVYMGFCADFLQILSDSNLFQVKKVISIKHRITPAFQALIEEHNYPNLILFAKEDMSKVPEFVGSCNLILINEFDYILSEDLIKNHVVINLHAGSLYTNRGAHPLVWTILNQEQDTTLSTYQLTGGIDEGILIHEYSVPVLDRDNIMTLRTKLADGFPFALEAIQQYMAGQIKGKGVYGGVYRRKVTEQDYTIDPATDSIASAYAKIRSQVYYNGAIYRDGKTAYRVKHFTVEDYNNSETSFSFQKNRLTVIGDNHRIICECVPSMNYN